MTKQLATTTKLAADAVTEKDEIKCALEELQHSQQRAEESIQRQTNGLSEEKVQLEHKIAELEAACRQYEEKVEDLEANKCAEIAQLNIQREKLEAEKKALMDDLENIRNEKEDLLRSNEERIVALKQSLDMTESDSKKAYDEVVENKLELEAKLNEFEQEMRNFQEKYEQLQLERDECVGGLENKCREGEEKVVMLSGQVEGLEGEKTAWAQEKDSLVSELEQRKGEVEMVRGEIEVKEQEIVSLNEKFNDMEAKYTVRLRIIVSFGNLTFFYVFCV